jgi:N-glycosylase/DNA lyase
MKVLLDSYKKRKEEIKERLLCFRNNYEKDDESVFSELSFCLLTPQSKAVICDKAVRELEKRGLLLKGTEKEVRSCLRGVRFPNNKAKYILAARKLFMDCREAGIKNKLDKKDIFKTRDWLVKNVKGFGYKEASHFLRNIGLGEDLAILDRHILKNLKRYRIIKEIPLVLTGTKYMDIEKKMIKYFKKFNIPIEEIDLLFWSNETGMIFK